MINMEPNKNGLTPDDLLFIAVFVSLMMVGGAMAWLELIKLELSAFEHH